MSSEAIVDRLVLIRWSARPCKTTAAAHSKNLPSQFNLPISALVLCNKERYTVTMILTYGDSATEDIANGKNSAKSRKVPADIRRRAEYKIVLIDTATDVTDLRTPPGNHLESLKGNLEGFHSIRINQQWRIVFRWVNGNAEDVEIVDYHR